jgi:glycerol uptake facilitator-like aquaporin
MGERLSDGNDAIALIGNTLATGAILVVLITIFAPVSGAHFNPVVTLVFALRGETSWLVAASYVPVQIVSAIAGTALAHVMFELPIMSAGTQARDGIAVAVADGVATFALVIAILGTLAVRPRAVPFNVGLVIAAGYWFTSSTSFANPAVTIARSLTSTFSGIRPEDVPIFILAQVAGALVATGCAAAIWPRGAAVRPLEDAAEGRPRLT